MMVYNNYPVAPWSLYNNLIFPRKAKIINSAGLTDYVFPDIPRQRAEGNRLIRGITSYCLNIMENGVPSDAGVLPQISINVNGTIASISQAIYWQGRGINGGTSNFIMPSIKLKSKVKSSYWYDTYDSNIHVRNVGLTGFDSVTHKYPSSWTSDNTPSFFHLDTSMYVGLSQTGYFDYTYPCTWMVIRVNNINAISFGFLGGVSDGFSGNTIDTATNSNKTGTVYLTCPGKTSDWNNRFEDLRSDATIGITSTGNIYIKDPNGHTCAYIRQLDTNTFFMMRKLGVEGEGWPSMSSPNLLLSRPVLEFSKLNASSTASINILAFGQDFYKVLPIS